MVAGGRNMAITMAVAAIVVVAMAAMFSEAPCWASGLAPWSVVRSRNRVMPRRRLFIMPRPRPAPITPRRLGRIILTDGYMCLRIPASL